MYVFVCKISFSLGCILLDINTVQSGSRLVPVAWHNSFPPLTFNRVVPLSGESVSFKQHVAVILPLALSVSDDLFPLFLYSCPRLCEKFLAHRFNVLVLSLAILF